MKQIARVLLLVQGFALGFALGFAEPAQADQFDSKLKQLMALENVEYLTLKQAGTVFDLDGWALQVSQRGYHNGVALAYIANYMADKMHLVATHKNSTLDEPWTRLAYINRSGQWRADRNAKLVARRLPPVRDGQYTNIGLQFYPALEERTDNRPDLTIVFRRARTGLKVFNIVTSGNNLLGDPLHNLESKSPAEMTQLLLRTGQVTSAQVKTFGKLKF